MFPPTRAGEKNEIRARQTKFYWRKGRGTWEKYNREPLELPHLLSSASLGHGPEDRMGLALEKSSSLLGVFSKAAMPRTI